LIAAYGEIPEFVLLGGLVPDLLCSETAHRHVGTTDVDVQVDLEIQGGSVNAARLEGALRKAGFIPDGERVWRWRDQAVPPMVVKVEFLADLEDVPNQTTFSFDDCEFFGAVNLRGTGFARRLALAGPLQSLDRRLQQAEPAGQSGDQGVLLAEPGPTPLGAALRVLQG